MVVSRAIRATGCASCRLSLFRAFASLAGPPTRLQAISAKSPPSIPSSRVRWYSSQITREDGQQHGGNGQGFDTIEEIAEEAAEESIDGVQKSEMKSTGVSSLPWYLQVETPTKVPQPLSERQRIPDLPEAPPSILEPMLRQISIDLGLDNLSLLDLRKLDPPPALGANLLMIIGTARSEKHLHVSADRFCRWLRTTYKLRPDADGLLGRNELKLKLRRKSRRAKLMGSAADDTGDDGIRTGWVCVDVGVVEAPQTTIDETSAPPSFVGFGRRIDGVRVVVQMLTEEKRTEIDLEKLWGGILKRGGQPEIEGGEDDHVESTQLPEPNKQIEGRFSPNFGQSRGFHTSSRSFSPKAETRPSTSQPPSFTSYLPPGKGVPRYDVSDLQSLVISFSNSDKDMARATLEANGVSGKYGEWRCFVLDELKIWLESKPDDEAMQELGHGFTDHTSTQFLTCLHQTLSDLPSQAEGEAKIWLQSYAKRLGHPGYTTEGLLKTFREAQLFGVRISRESYLDLLQQVLRPDHDVNAREYSNSESATIDKTIGIIQAMHDQGYDILKEDVLVNLQESAAPLVAAPSPPDTVDQNSRYTFHLVTAPMPAIQRRLHVLMRTVDLPVFSDELRLRLLDLYSKNHHWYEFWDIWNMAPLRRHPQSATMYAYMFKVMANTENQRACMATLRTWISDMDLEVPKVELKGSVAEAVMACLKVADPLVQKDVLDPKANGEWISLWRRCTVHRKSKR